MPCCQRAGPPVWNAVRAPASAARGLSARAFDSMPGLKAPPVQDRGSAHPTQLRRRHPGLSALRRSALSPLAARRAARGAQGPRASRPTDSDVTARTGALMRQAPRRPTRSPSPPTTSHPWDASPRPAVSDTPGTPAQPARSALRGALGPLSTAGPPPGAVRSWPTAAA